MPLVEVTTKIPILMYHSISLTQNVKFYPFTVSPDSFAEQMHYLSIADYTPITVSHLVHIMNSPEQKLPERPVLLTFDDGFADFFSAAFPILQRYQFTATLYVATSFIEGTSRWLQHEGESMRPMISKNELRQIRAYGIECGGHTHSHPQLDTLALKQARHEITVCKDTLEQLLGEQIESFAYPFGYYTLPVQHLVQEAGYTSSCAVKHKMATLKADLFALPRLMVKPGTTVEDFDHLLHGKSISRLQALYLHMRTPLWSTVRRSSAFVSQHLQERSKARDNNR